jgi:hypothetical protein
MTTTVKQNTELETNSTILLNQPLKEYDIQTENGNCIIVHVESVTVETTKAPEKTSLNKPKNMIQSITQRIFKKQKASLVTLILSAVSPLTLPLCLVLVVGMGNVWGQYSITSAGSGNTYSQNFDAFRGTAVTLPTSWTVATASYNATYPILTSGNASPTVSNASGNNCYAGRASNSSLDYSILQKQGTSGSTTFTLNTSNNTGSSINGFVITWNVEQFSSAGRATTVNFSYSINGGSYVQTGITGTSLFTATTGSSTTFSLATTSRSITISGINVPNGQTANFRFTIANGTGSGSNAHIGIDDFTMYATAPATTPAAPTISSIAPGDQQLSVAFTAGSDGGSAITNYKYSTNGGTNWQTREAGTTASPLVISTLSTDGTTALTNGTSYNIQIRAVNAVGDGTATASTAATPRTTPSAPTISSITPGNQQLSVSFTAGSDGGSAITTYKYSTNGGLNWQTRTSGTTASPLVISTLSTDGTTALTNGVSYDIQIRAVNAAGDGTATGTTQGTPVAPVSPTLNAVTLSSSLSTTYGTASTGVGFTASGTSLTSNITATAQTGYQVSTDNSNFGASVSIASGTTVYVRYTSTISAGNYNNATAVVLSGGGASSSANVITSSSGNTVAQKTLTVTGLTAQNKVYNGSTTSSTTGTASLTGVVGADDVTLTGTPTFSFSSANVGTGISVSTIGYLLTGANSGNYTLTQPTFSSDITAANLTITANDVSKYSGVALSGGAGSTAFTSTGLQNGETIGSVTITYGAAGSSTGDGLTPGLYSSQVTPSLATGGTFTASNYSINYVAGSITVVAAPVNIFTENMGSPSGTTAIASHTFQNSSTFTFTNGGVATSADARITNVSSGYTGASGNGNVFFTGTTGSYGFAIEGIDVSTYTNLEVRFAYRKESGTVLPNLTIDYWNGSSYVNVPFSYNEAANAAVGWYLVNWIALPAGAQISTLRLRWVKSGTQAVRLDDISLRGIINTSPIILVSPSSLSGFSQNSSTPSSEQSYTVSGDNLTNDVTITPPTGYEISTSTGVSFSATSPITLSASGGNLVGEPVTIYVRQSASTLGVNSGNITHSSTGANSPNVPVSGTRTGSYYSKATGNLDDINSWGSNTDGTGSTPSNFSTDGIIYEIRNRTTATIGTNWTVTGTASKVLVGDGTNSTDFTIPSGFALSGTVDVNNGAELTLENATAPTFGTFATNSTLEYKDLPITLSTSTTYKNLKLTGSGTKTFPGGTTNITGNLVLTNTTTDGGSGPFSTISLSGDLTYVGTVTPPADVNSITLSTNGTAGGIQTITGGGNTLRWFRIQSTTANTILLSTSGGSSNLHVGNGSGGGITLLDGSILNMNGNDFTLFSSSGSSTAFLLNTTASISTNSSTDFTLERIGNGNLGTLRFTSGSNTIGNLTLKHIGISNNLLTLGSDLSINGSLTLTTGVLSVGANTLSLNGSVNRTSGFIDASNAAATIVFGGSSSQNIPASTFFGNIANLTLNNGSGLSTSQNLTVASGLSLTSGTLTVGANTLTLNGSINPTSGNIDASNSSATVIFSGASAQSIPASTFTGNINNLTLNNSAGLSISQDLSVVGALTLSSGKLTLGTNHLTLGETATTSGTFSSNNMIIATGLGELRKRFAPGSGDVEPFTFPIGNGGEISEYTPIVLDFASGNYGANAYVGVRVQDSKQATLNSSVTNYLNRNWIVEPNDITGFSYKIQLYYVDADFITDGSMAEGDLLPIKISSGQWYQPTDGTFTNAVSQGSAGVFASANYLEWNGLTTFSEFGGASGSNLPLPVELLSFTAECANESIVLKWQTASEFNSAYFEIQKSLDGITWNTIGNQTAAGNSNELLSYSFEDASKSDNTSYYRLNQVDIDGLQKYYGPISPLCESLNHLKGKTIPNPSNDEFWLQITSDDESPAYYVIKDVKGNTVFQHQIAIQKGLNLYHVNSSLPSGMYFIRIVSENEKSLILKHLQN